MSLQVQFDQAVEDVKNLKQTPANDILLEIYALYKQATVGDCNTPQPGMLDFKGKAKWESWKHKAGTSQDKAKQDYVNRVKSLVDSVGLKE
ncbi:hypothetical protein HA402_010468 [Bradysia odoriphaga]|nr:hypothetical protein HA402_010468 [Bradysia odoriphaga]